MRGPVLDRDRVWFSVQNISPDGDDTTAHLWSAALGSDGTARDEHVDIGTFDVHDGVLTYLEHSNAADSRMHVRDLATGDDHVYDTPSGPDCNQLALERIGERVALFQCCGRNGGVRDDRA